MKLRVLPALALLSGVASVALGSTNVTYTASADPNASPDSNNNTVDAWTLSKAGDTAGQSNTYSGSYYAGPTGMLSSAWAIYCNDNYTPTTAGQYTTETDQNAVFPGGALNVGQTVSIDFLANSVDTGREYGLRLTNGGAFSLSISYIGGNNGGNYQYYDGASSGNTALPYQQNGFHFAYTQTSATTYMVVATPIGGGAVLGMFSGTDGNGGAPNTLQIYDESAGTNNNVLTNNFSIVPEPGSYVFLGAGMLGAVALLRRRQRPA